MKLHWKVLTATCSGEIIYNYLYPNYMLNIFIMHIHLPDRHCDVNHFHHLAFASEQSLPNLFFLGCFLTIW